MKTSRSEGADNILTGRDRTLQNLTSVADLSDAVRRKEEGLCEMKYSLGEAENTVMRQTRCEFTSRVLVPGSVIDRLL